MKKQESKEEKLKKLREKFSGLGFEKESEKDQNEPHENEEDTLEKKVNQEPEVNFSGFSGSEAGWTLDEVKAPVLQRIPGISREWVRADNLEQDVSTAPAPETKEEDPFKYTPSNQNQEEPKYATANSSINVQPSAVDPREARLSFSPGKNVNQKSMFMHAEYPETQDEFHKRYDVDNFDVDQVGREDPLKKDLKKYDVKRPHY